MITGWLENSLKFLSATVSGKVGKFESELPFISPLTKPHYMYIGHPVLGRLVRDSEVVLRFLHTQPPLRRHKDFRKEVSERRGGAMKKKFGGERGEGGRGGGENLASPSFLLFTSKSEDVAIFKSPFKGPFEVSGSPVFFLICHYL